MEPTATDALDTLERLDPLDRLNAIDPIDPPVVREEREPLDDADALDADARITRPALTVGASSIHGTGVFAAASFAVDDVIEECPVLVVVPKHAKKVANTVFGDYVYEWNGGYGLALGYGSLYNHSRTSNARYEMDYDIDEIHIVAIRPIEPGDEITINYNGDPTDPSPVWFEVDD